MTDLGRVLAAFVPLSFMLYWIITLLTNVSNADWTRVRPQVIALVSAFGLAAAYAHSNIVGSETIARLSWIGQLFVAWAIAAGGGTIADFARVFNHSDGSTRPQMFQRGEARSQ